MLASGIIGTTGAAITFYEASAGNTLWGLSGTSALGLAGGYLSLDLAAKFYSYKKDESEFFSEEQLQKINTVKRQFLASSFMVFSYWLSGISGMENCRRL